MLYSGCGDVTSFSVSLLVSNDCVRSWAWIKGSISLGSIGISWHDGKLGLKSELQTGKLSVGVLRALGGTTAIGGWTSILREPVTTREADDNGRRSDGGGMTAG